MKRLFTVLFAVGVPLLLSGAPAEGEGPEAWDRFLRGIQLAEEGRLEEAAQELRAARTLDPDAPDVSRELARVLLEARRPKEALEPAREAIRLAPEEAESHAVLGQALLQLSRSSEALEPLRRAMELAPEERSHRVNLLLALESIGKLEEACRLVEPSEGGIEPESPYLLMRRGTLRTRLGRPQEALEDYLAALVQAPGYPGAADHLLALCWRLGPSRVTASACRRALEAVPHRTDLRRELTRILILLNRQEEAIPDLERLMIDDPSDPRVPMQLGVVRFGQERLREAIALFRRARRLDPDLQDSGDWLWRALSRADSVEAALRVAEEMAAAEPESPKAVWYYARSLARLGRTEESLAALKTVHRLDPENRQARLLAAILLDEQGDGDGARTQLEKILEGNETDREILFRLAVLEDRQGRTEAALVWLRRLIEAHPDDAMALNYAGYMCATNGVALEEALEWTRRAAELEPETAAYVDSYGWVLYQLGRHEEAVTQLERARDLDPDEPEILMHLARAYRSAGKVEAGVRLLRNRLRTAPADRETRELLQLWEGKSPADSGNPR
ncbi:MAG: tetratricopeptide repeat protein [Candidatus Eisenbacteria bacterium]|nr:tetratricopeptide repeat protein [Candidatus Latescibacterota bacterium]MBD3302375.1 tetratricopeptide repeat protein [Candidatus Eisenbacteria bacterium]